MPPHPEVMSRRIRGRLLSWLPARQRARMRRLYERAAAPAARATATFHDHATTLVLAIDGGPEIRLLPECRYAIERQFTDPEAAAELWKFMACVTEPGVLFDVGANHGLFSLVYCLSDPRNAAVAFEPSPRLADVIRQLARLNGIDERLEVVAKAVAEQVGERELLLDEQNGYVQSEVFAGTDGGTWGAMPIPLTTLDEHVRSITPTLVKIDVEGYEHEALLGAHGMLAGSRPTIFLELHLNYLQARGVLPSAITGLLERHGYRVADLSGARRSTREISRSWASVLHLIATADPG